MGISFHLVYIHETDLKSQFLPNPEPIPRTSDKFHEVTMEPEPSWYPWDRMEWGPVQKRAVDRGKSSSSSSGSIVYQ